MNITFDSTGLKDPQVPHTGSLIQSLEVNRVASDTSDTGVGKTYCAAAVARHFQLPVFVVCPKAVIPTWKTVLSSYGVTKYTIVNYDLLVRSKGNKYVKWTYDSDQDTFKATFKKTVSSDTIFILDECHRCKALDSLNSELHMAIKDQGFRLLNLSASAATTILEMKSFGYTNGLHEYRNANDYKRHYCVKMGAEWSGRFGGLIWDPESEKCREGMAFVHNELYNVKKTMFRLTREQMGAHFPETQINADALDMGANSVAINRVYNHMQAELALLDERTSNYSQHVFAIIMAARRQAELLKVPTFVSMIEDYVDEGMSVAVFTNFNETMDAIAKRLLKLKKFVGKIGFIRGGQSALERQRDIEAFQKDEKIVTLAHIGAGGVGVSLHDLNGKRARASILSPGFSAVQLYQAFGRVWRLGGLTKSIQHVIFAAGTIEEKACNRLRARLGNLSILNDGDMTAGINIPEHRMMDFYINGEEND
jgi:hypothetical protein